MHRTNARLAADFDVIVRHRVPVVITSLGAASEVVDAVHSYGGVVFHDVTSAHHARKAADAGVDGLILVAAGAGGHAGSLSPFALMAEVRVGFSGTILLAGAISSGSDVLAARAMGADLAYLGTRFVATTESMATDAYRDEIVSVTTTMAVTDKETKAVTQRTATVDIDTCNRRGTTYEALAKLEPVMGAGKFVTAGNASQLSDGASACVMVEAREAERLGLAPLGAFRGLAWRSSRTSCARATRTRARPGSRPGRASSSRTSSRRTSRPPRW